MLTSRTLSSGATRATTPMSPTCAESSRRGARELGAGERAPLDPQLPGDGGCRGVVARDMRTRMPASLHKAMASLASLRGGR